MCIPILEVEGYEADDVTAPFRKKGAEAGYDVYMVTPDKDYGQLVRDRCRIYKQRGADGSIEIVGREEIRESTASTIRSWCGIFWPCGGMLRTTFRASPGDRREECLQTGPRMGYGGEYPGECRPYPRKTGREDRCWADNLRLAKRLTTICLDVPIELREEDLTVCRTASR